MVGVVELERHPVRARRQVLDDEGITAHSSPVPRQIVDGNVDVPDARRNRERRRAEHGHDPQVLGPELEDDQALGQRLCQGLIDDDPGGRLLHGQRHNGGGTEDLARGLREGAGGAHHGNRCKQRKPLRCLEPFSSPGCSAHKSSPSPCAGGRRPGRPHCPSLCNIAGTCT